MDNQEFEAEKSEFELLKERARTLGINPGNSSLASLKAKIAAKMNDEPDEEEEEMEPAVTVSAEKPRKQTKAEWEQETRERLYREKMYLMRCRIYNLNPSKRDLKGEIITVANRYLGTVRKFIPFGEVTDNGYHIPKVIYDDLKARRFQDIRTRTVNGQIQVSSRDVPEYSIEVLPPLTEQELKDLASRQQAVETLGGSNN